MFELSDDLVVQEETFQNSKIYTIDNFFKDPEKIISYMKSAPHYLWKGFVNPTDNGKHYKYKKIFQVNNEIDNVEKFMNPYIGERKLQIRGFVLSDFFLLKNDYNDYQNKYFWPHKDFGYTGVIFLNHYDGPGTNLYSETVKIARDNMISANSAQAWVDKDIYKLEKVLMSKYNRCIFFDAFKFYHNIAVDDEEWFNNHRYNIVVHYTNEPIRSYNGVTN